MLTESEAVIRVVAAVIERDGAVLVCQRPAGKRHGGLWEFPGGKVEPGESDVDAVSRELGEELGVGVEAVGEPEFSVRDPGSPFQIEFLPARITGEPRCIEHSALAWLRNEALTTVPLAPSDLRYAEWRRTRAPDAPPAAPASLPARAARTGAAPRRRPPDHLLIVLLTGIGDVVNALPLANALKRAWPATRLSWVTEPPSASLLAGHPAVDNVIVYRKREGWRGVQELWRRMRGERFDLTLNLMPYFKSNWPTAFSRAPERWTFGPERARDGVWLIGNRRLPAGPRQHTLDMFLEFAAALGVDPHPLAWRLDVTPAERLLQQRLREQLDGRPGVAVVLASANAKKDWPAERYVPVVDAIQSELGARAVLLGGTGDRELAAARLVAAHAAHPPLWFMERDVRSLVWVQDACAATVAPDTGPMHIARAVGTPVVALFGHTNPWRTGPYRAFEELWIDRYTEPGTPPDPSNFTPKLGRMETIEPAEVIDRLARALRYPRR